MAGSSLTTCSIALKSSLIGYQVTKYPCGEKRLTRPPARPPASQPAASYLHIAL